MSAATNDSATTMTVGVLICDHLDDEVVAHHDDYEPRYRELLAPSGATVEVFDLTASTPPDPGDCDAWLVGGSRRSATDDDGGVPELVDFCRRAAEARVPQVGICFGHQVIGLALGGRVERAARWGLGVQRYEVVAGAPWMAPHDSPAFSLVASHRDQVVELPPGAELLAGSEYCGIAAYRVAEHVFCVQGHPEFDAPLSATLAERRREALGDDVVDAALATLGRPQDAELLGRWIAGFLAPAR